MNRLFQVSVTAIRKLVHVIWVATKDEIPDSVPKDVYYVYRFLFQTIVCMMLHTSGVRGGEYPVP